MLAVAADAEDNGVRAPLVVEAAVCCAMLAQEIGAVSLAGRGLLEHQYFGAAPVGVLSGDLRTACLEALKIPPQICLDFAAAHTWDASARVFVEHALNVRAEGPEVRAEGPEGETVEFVAEGPHFAA